MGSVPRVRHGSGTLSRHIWKGPADWDSNDTRNTDEDLEQNAEPKEIFVVDAPGWGDSKAGLPYTANYRYSEKNKFREWVEVEIGGKWYVCSEYFEWRSIMHIKYQDATTGWIEDTTKTNEIVPGTINDFAGSWSED